MHFVIFSGGKYTSSILTKKAIESADVIVGVDSGVDTALKNGVTPNVLVGDLDSISEETKRNLEKYKIRFANMPTTLVSLPIGREKALNPSEKDQTDTEMAIEYAVKNGADKITILAGMEGDRLDHVIANIFQTIDYSIPIFFVNGFQTAWIAKGPVSQKITGEKGDTISLIPLTSEVVKITTKKMYYPLKNEILFFGKARGLSNIITEDNPDVSFEKGILLLVLTSKI